MAKKIAAAIPGFGPARVSVGSALAPAGRTTRVWLAIDRSSCGAREVPVNFVQEGEVLACDPVPAKPLRRDPGRCADAGTLRRIVEKCRGSRRERRRVF